ncbi:Zn-dependent oligopeptidase [Leptospira biflexa serovar Patoc strain 'Patoc 1 (Ames)']|uniref:oligopeptidase A n=1 Tax=Leptospira biflexa serovar Patoc (strain Patoc 1 / ATCC 23582 / Paris) TaxID=456481 RepID=B0SMF9_LEPBP|nr:M3 family metallopeptidase [Leptospira biflexa]ABZ93474.1 Zn-dependent oligopeptidase [Leptospira biflexa serovar Patoc strain 'Patoc 1 (Ames)']ABZ97103.1 Oligopeptidase A [Leptospira biflexa serovar Patoc strain 'Patoc 1 (Paris)']
MFPEFHSNNLLEKESTILKKMESNKEFIQSLLKQPNGSFQTFLKPYQRVQTELGDLVTEISHLNSVKNSEESQTIYSRLLPKLSEYYTDLGQNEEIFSALLHIQSTDKTVNSEQIKVLENEIRDFRLSGVGLDSNTKEELKNIRIKLSDLTNQFSQNVLNATNAFALYLNEEDVKGIPESDKISAKQPDGTYKFTLHFPSYIAYMTYGENRKIRKEMYDAYCTRAPENGKLIEEILSLRDKEAKLLGFETYAHLSLATKVANEPEEVIQFLDHLAKKAKPIAQKEYKEIQSFAKKLGQGEIEPWDLTFYSEKLKKESFSYDEEIYRPYLEKETVLQGTFQFLENLLGVHFKQVQTNVWEPSVLCYDLVVEGETRSRLYLDLEVRSDKKGGAWMHNWKPHFQDETGKTELPIAFVVASFPKATESQPSLLRPSDVVTLFHELGHALHHLLSKVKEAFVSGVNGVEWDAVEFPSQFLENFVYEPKVLQLFAKHYQTKEPIPNAYIDTMVKAKNFMSAMGVVRQLEFAKFDMLVHKESPNEIRVQDILNQVREEIAVVVPPTYNKFQNSFTHIFAGGYAAGYYSYKWAELLSANAFYSFVDKGVFDLEHAAHFRKTVLEKGGSANAMNLFRDFYGKDPDIDALLRLNGIAA